jgi:hypothetical protein
VDLVVWRKCLGLAVLPMQGNSQGVVGSGFVSAHVPEEESLCR